MFLIIGSGYLAANISSEQSKSHDVYVLTRKKNNKVYPKKTTPKGKKVQKAKKVSKK